jgi:hypothetical protein
MSLTKTLGRFIYGAAIIGTSFASSTAMADSNEGGRPQGNGLSSGKAVTNVIVNVPEVMILHYYDTLTLDFSAAGETINQGGKDFDISWQGGTYDGGLTDKSSALKAGTIASGDKVAITLQNAWAIRGFSNNGKASVSITSTAPKLNKDNKSYIGLDNFYVAYNGAKGSSVEAPLRGLSASKATSGDVGITLNFAETTLSGQHKGGSFTLEAKTI